MEEAEMELENDSVVEVEQGGNDDASATAAEAAAPADEEDVEGHVWRAGT
jgi:hypothetical protein